MDINLVKIKTEPEDFEYYLSPFDISREDIFSEPSASNSPLQYETQIVPDPSDDEEMKSDPLAEFCFESDHPALKYNNDYKTMLATIAILETQRSIAIKDLNKLNKLEKEALKDPITFVERLHQNEDMGIPGRQDILSVPDINFDQYKIEAKEGPSGRRKLQTRTSSRVGSSFNLALKQQQLEDSRPKIVNLWSAEEQKKLEDLLVLFPPEEVEARRWQKIANSLENRTPIQVASRVQKYFIKLLKAGLPIPGRMPSISHVKKPKRQHIRNTPSTFLASRVLPISMPYSKDDFKFSTHQFIVEVKKEPKKDDSDDETISSELKESAEFKELMLLKQLQKERLLSSSQTRHVGYKCGSCKSDPIIGVRWHCSVCNFPSVDLCNDCAKRNYEFGRHTSSHNLQEIPATHDIASSSCTDFAYLGSNYTTLESS